MRINQLFKSYVQDDLFNKLLFAFGLETINDCRMFSTVDLQMIGTVRKLEELKNDIYKYYLPCKAKLYLSNLDENKCVTVLRQVLRLRGLILKSTQKYVKKKKIVFYSIQKKKDDLPSKTIKIYQTTTVIVFN